MRRKKVYPPGTFIPFPQRFLAIIQLCLGFSFILWYGFQPFMGEYFALKTQMLPYEFVMGTSDLLKGPEGKEKLERNRARFELLDSKKKSELLNGYKRLHDYSTRPFHVKIWDGIRASGAVPPFVWAWIILSIVLPIMLLLKFNGARLAVWLLPLVAICGVVDQRDDVSKDQNFYPTEDVIVKEYVGEPLKDSIEEQRKQLEKGWRSYLAKNWSDSQNVEEGEFYFTLASLEKMVLEIPTNWKKMFSSRSGFLLSLIFILWNVAFALNSFVAHLSGTSNKAIEKNAL